jgi:putative two-component system response regulator
MIVDDELVNLQVLARLLAQAGITQIECTRNPLEALSLYRRTDPDLVVLDLHMPNLDGITLLEQLRQATPPGGFLPVLMLTGDSTSERRRTALGQGATDFLLKPFDPQEVVLRIRNLLETRFLHLMLQGQNQNLEHKVTLRTRELEEAQVEVLERLAIAAEFRDDETGRHTQRVASVAAVLSEALSLPQATVDLVRRAAPLHDVGKIGVPDHILLKPGRLTAQEFEVMQTHTTIGAQILGGGRSALMHMAEQIARSHHERWDGTGYPDRIAREAIPIAARVVAVADFYDALSHDRPYRDAWPPDAVQAEIVRLREQHFDPRVVDAFFSLEPHALVFG